MGRSRPSSAADRAQLLDRVPATDDMVRTTSEAIIDVVRREGDSALISLAREYDHVRLKSVEVPRDAWRDALRALDPGVRAAMERAATNIRAVHSASPAADGRDLAGAGRGGRTTAGSAAAGRRVRARWARIRTRAVFSWERSRHASPASAK